jgi:hypothetical protein
MRSTTLPPYCVTPSPQNTHTHTHTQSQLLTVNNSAPFLSRTFAKDELLMTAPKCNKDVSVIIHQCVCMFMFV